MPRYPQIAARKAVATCNARLRQATFCLLAFRGKDFQKKSLPGN